MSVAGDVLRGQEQRQKGAPYDDLANQTSTRFMFEFADGMRAFAAITVAIRHATTIARRLGDADEDLPVISHITELGICA